MEKEFDLFNLLVFLVKRKYTLLIGLIFGLCAALGYLAYCDAAKTYRSTASFVVEGTGEHSNEEFVLLASSINKALKLESSFASMYKGFENFFNLTTKKAYNQGITSTSGQMPITVAIDEDGSHLSIIFESSTKISSRDELVQASQKFLNQALEALQKDSDNSASESRTYKIEALKFLSAEREIFELMKNVKRQSPDEFPYIYTEPNALHRILAATTLLEDKGVISHDKSKDYQELIYQTIASINNLSSRTDSPNFTTKDIKAYLSRVAAKDIRTTINETVAAETKNRNIKFILIIISGIFLGFLAAATMEYYEGNKSRLQNTLREISSRQDSSAG